MDALLSGLARPQVKQSVSLMSGEEAEDNRQAQEDEVKCLSQGF